MIKELKDLAGMLPSLILTMTGIMLAFAAIALLDYGRNWLAFACTAAIWPVWELARGLILEWARK